MVQHLWCAKRSAVVFLEHPVYYDGSFDIGLYVWSENIKGVLYCKFLPSEDQTLVGWRSRCANCHICDIFVGVTCTRSVLQNCTWPRTSQSTIFTSDIGGGKCFLLVFVCLYVCLLARLLKNACTKLNEMLRVDRCRDMDELINFWARSGLQSGCRNRIAFSDIVCAATRNFITLGKSHVHVLGARRCSEAWF